jgi:ectoine hydroxylase-related dioxygenase (phytanoyl-CoA dioxygenase family)
VTGHAVTMDDAAQAFARDGVACVRQVLDPGQVAAAVAAIDAVLAAPGPLAQVASGTDDPGAFVEDFCRWREIPQIEELARHSRVPAVAAALMATPRVRFYHDHVLVKEGRTAQRTPWHQDQPYYNVDGHGVSAWITVDPVPEGGSLELVAGSHRGPWLMPRTFLRKEARWFPDGSLAELPDISDNPSAFDIRRFGLEPGDAIFFDFLTVHGAPGFPYPTRRRILSLRYLAADARHAPRPWRTSPPFDDLAAELPAGAAMDHPLFPVVWGGSLRPPSGPLRS